VVRKREEKRREEKLNVQHSTFNAQRRIEEILNKEKETTKDRKLPSPVLLDRRCHPSVKTPLWNTERWHPVL
jgi:hypothetical protein